MNNIEGNIKEDEQEAFNLICERTGVDPDQAKGVGFFNRLIKLCSVAKLSVEFDYSGDDARFKVTGVPGAKPKEEYVAPPELNTTDADEDEDDSFPEAEDNDEDPFDED
jgi:hypothetical protein